MNFKKNTRTPEVVIRPCLSMVISCHFVCLFVFFAMHICGAKFQEHCFNTSRDIVYLVFYHFLVGNSMTSYTFISVKDTHNYNTRLLSGMTYALPKTRTNYGTFNIRYQGARICNDISDDI